MKNVISMIIALFLVTAVSFSAQPMKGKGGMFHKNIKAQLKLTPDQEKQFDDITYKQQQAAIDLRAKLQKNRLDLKKMISEKTLDADKVLQITDENSKLQAELKRGMITRWLDIYKILNADQKDIFMKGLSKLLDNGMMTGRMGMRGHMMGNRMKGMGMIDHGMNNRGMMWKQQSKSDQPPAENKSN